MRLTGRRPQHPGNLIESEINARGWSQSDLAKMIEKPVSVVSDIINGKRNLTVELAYLFSLVLDISFDLLIKIDAYNQVYDTHMELEKKNKIEAMKTLGKLNTIAPVRLMEKNKWIKKTKDLNNLKEEIMDFYGIDELVDDVADLKLNPSYRKSDYGYVNEVAVTAWSYRVNNLAEKIRVPEFSKDNIKDNIKKLVSLSKEVTNVSKVKDFLAGLGVKLVYQKHLPGTKIDGATFWDENGNPVIGMTLRYNRIDYYWFTLLHEIGHIMTGKDKSAIVDIDMKFDETPEEKKANDYAVKKLIDEKIVEKKLKGEKITRKKILEIAEETGVHEAIIVGHLQYEQVIPYSYFRNLLEGYRKYVKFA